MKSREEEFSERMEKILKQRDSKPSNCKHCQLRFRDGETEYICARTERQTFFGTKAEKCYGDCEHYEKNMGELFRDMLLSAIKGKIKNHKAHLPKCDTMDNLQSWMNGYSQCQRDILEIIDSIENDMGRR